MARHAYDGDRLRVKRNDNGTITYYVRSSVLGGQVVAELNSTGSWMRGYVYLGGQMVGIQANGTITWVHQDPYSKGQRFTNTSGTYLSGTIVEVDPWGGNTARSVNSAFQPHLFTSYERDSDNSDEATNRRYLPNSMRFSQGDPYDGSYDLTNPQSLNRYSYVQNDPVNFIDPSGLMMDIGWCSPQFSSCSGSGGGGYGGTPFDSGSILFGGYDEVPANLRPGVMQHDQLANNYRFSDETLHDISFAIAYGYLDGNFWTNFNLSTGTIAIPGMSDSLMGTFRWPPGGERWEYYRFNERTPGTPRVVDESGNPIRTVPRTEDPGIRREIRVEPRDIFKPKLNPSNPEIPENLSVGRKILYGGLRILSGVMKSVGRITVIFAGPSFLGDPCVMQGGAPKGCPGLKG